MLIYGCRYYFFGRSIAISQEVTFAPQVEYAVGSKPWQITKGDFNLDGNLDLGVINELSGNFSILLGTGEGSFISQIRRGSL